MVISSLLLLLSLHTVQSGIVPGDAQELPLPEAQEQSFGFTIYGVKCISTCRRGALASSYYCDTYGTGGRHHKWDYCSTSPKVTIYGEKCKDNCRMSRYNYRFCNTESSWDYCSNGGGGGDTPAFRPINLYWLIVIPVAIVLCIVGYKLYKYCKQSSKLSTCWENFLNPSPVQRESEGFLPENSSTKN